MTTASRRADGLVHEVREQVDSGVLLECRRILPASQAIMNPTFIEGGEPVPVSCHDCLRVILERCGFERDQEIADASRQEVEADRPITVRRHSQAMVHGFSGRSQGNNIIESLCSRAWFLVDVQLDPTSQFGNPLLVTCQECRDIISIRIDSELAAREIQAVAEAPEVTQEKRVVHWTGHRGCSVWAGRKVSLGTYTGATSSVTCEECKALPRYRVKRFEDVEFVLGSVAVHLSTEEGVLACGFRNPVNIDTDLAKVTCPGCLRLLILPELENQPTRRILLDGNG